MDINEMESLQDVACMSNWSLHVILKDEGIFVSKKK